MATASTTMDESFEDCVTHLMIMMEELKRNMSASPEDHVLQLDGMLGRLDFLRHMQGIQNRNHNNDNNDNNIDTTQKEVMRDMYQNCRQRVVQVARQVLERTVTPSPDDQLVFDDEHVESQAAVARMAELNLIVNTIITVDGQEDEQQQQQSDASKQAVVAEIITLYANYQKQVLRQRSKPAIAYLANWRKTNLHSKPGDNNKTKNGHDDDDDDETITQPHSHALTSVLSHASALIHPLQQWKDALPLESPTFQMCTTSIQILNEQAELLVKTISDWFLQDKSIDQWMQLQLQQQHPTQKINLSDLDSLVDEMAFCCQVMARYTALMDATPDSSEPTNVAPHVIQHDLLPEWTWKYAALERFLAVQQLESALAMASPVDIVLGLNIQVPSVVEDAQYLSTRALDRAMSTRNTQAMGTVAHSLSNEIWSTDGTSGVYQALLDQRGCCNLDALDTPKKKDPSSSMSTTKVPKSGDFASALLDALDEDLKQIKTPPSTAPLLSPPPQSGGFLGALVMGGEMQQVRLDTQLCAMNGIYSASTSCLSLVESLDAWLEEHDDRMIGLARDELMRFSRSYKELLQQQVIHSIGEWCGLLTGGGASLKGKCLHALRDFMQRERYDLDATSFTKAEADDRLEAVLLSPFKESKFISQLDKCEAEVCLAIAQELSQQVADLIMESLWQSRKRFTDWGSLLLSKQVRLLQSYVMGLTNVDSAHGSMAPSTSFLDRWERLSQVVTVLQLERPSDWSIYQSTSVLTVDELRQTLSLRIDFSSEAISAICQAQMKT